MKHAHIIFIGICILFMIGSYFGRTSYNEQGTMGKNISTLSEHTAPVLASTGICIRDPNIQYFMYHYIRDNDPRDPITTHNLSIPPAQFRRQIQSLSHLRDEGKIELPTGTEFLEEKKNNCFKNRNVWILTVDDGWSDMYDTLVPIAKDYTTPFFLGIITDKVGTKGFVSRDQVQLMADNPLFTISSHSRSHRNHATMTHIEEEGELCTSKILLEEMTQTSIETYIFPSGKFSTSSEKIANKCGYILTWSTHFGTDTDTSQKDTGPINRIRITRNTPDNFFENYFSSSSISTPSRSISISRNR